MADRLQTETSNRQMKVYVHLPIVLAKFIIFYPGFLIRAQSPTFLKHQQLRPTHILHDFSVRSAYLSAVHH